MIRGWGWGLDWGPEGLPAASQAAESEIVCIVLLYENDVCSLTSYFCFPFFGCPKHVISVGSAVL